MKDAISRLSRELLLTLKDEPTANRYKSTFDAYEQLSSRFNKVGIDPIPEPCGIPHVTVTLT